MKEYSIQCIIVYKFNLMQKGYTHMGRSLTSMETSDAVLPPETKMGNDQSCLPGRVCGSAIRVLSHMMSPGACVTSHML